MQVYLALLLLLSSASAQLFWSPYPPEYYGIETQSSEEALDDEPSAVLAPEELNPHSRFARSGGPELNPWMYSPNYYYGGDDYYEDEEAVFVRTPRKKNKGGYGGGGGGKKGGGGGGGHGWGHHVLPQQIHTYEKPVFHLTGPPMIITGKPTYVTDYYYVKKPQPQHHGWGGWH